MSTVVDISVLRVKSIDLDLRYVIGRDGHLVQSHLGWSLWKYIYRRSSIADPFIISILKVPKNV